MMWRPGGPREGHSGQMRVTYSLNSRPGQDGPNDSLCILGRDRCTEHEGRTAGGPSVWTRSGRRVRWQPGPVEGDPPVAHRDVRVVADHQVVQHGDIEEPARGERLGGQVEVVR